MKAILGNRRVLPAPGVINNVTLVEIDKNGSQFYTWPKKHITMGNSMKMSGWGRASNVKVGDKGKLVWTIGHGYGLWFFRPYNKIG